jgi:hypothetical protein
MSRTHVLDERWNPWKLATLGLLVTLATALVTGVVVANYAGNQSSEPAGAPHQERVQHAAVRPSAADIEACNEYASSVGRDRTKETLTDALLGGVVGAGVGAAGGAIADGGGGAGKGAGIGGLVGATAGTLYGLKGTREHDGRAAAAYRACMKGRGFVD